MFCCSVWKSVTFQEIFVSAVSLPLRSFLFHRACRTRWTRCSNRAPLFRSVPGGPKSKASFLVSLRWPCNKNYGLQHTCLHVFVFLFWHLFFSVCGLDYDSAWCNGKNSPLGDFLPASAKNIPGQRITETNPKLVIQFQYIVLLSCMAWDNDIVQPKVFFSGETFRCIQYFWNQTLIKLDCNKHVFFLNILETNTYMKQTIKLSRWSEIVIFFNSGPSKTPGFSMGIFRRQRNPQPRTSRGSQPRACRSACPASRTRRGRSVVEVGCFRSLKLLSWITWWLNHLVFKLYFMCLIVAMVFDNMTTYFLRWVGEPQARSILNAYIIMSSMVRNMVFWTWCHFMG